MAAEALRDVVADDDLAILSCAEMRIAETLAMEGLRDEHGTVAQGVSSTELMETAGAAVAAAVGERYLPQPTVVLCGPGNNGGDGFVVARQLEAAGWPVRVGLLGERERLGGDALNAAELWGGIIEAATPDLLEDHPLVIDALFGIGLKRPLEGMAKALVTAINARDLACVAIDLPSGLDGDTGAVLGAVPRCELTVTFFRPKTGHLSSAGRACCGDLRVAEIGVPRGVLRQLDVRQWRNGPGLWRHALRRPALDDHKYRRGHVVVFGGDTMTGAARLSALAARRVGAGLVTIAGSPAATTVYRLAEPGNLVVDLADAQALAGLTGDPRKNAFVVGPGAGTGAQAAERLLATLAAGRGAVIDADAITVAAGMPDRFFAMIRGQTLLTPHEGEFARLFPDLAGLPGKLDRARQAARRSGATILLKGPDTTIAAPDGRAIVSDNAPPTLATAGSGDVLSGMAGGLMAQGMTAFAAAAAACWLHGAAARRFGFGLIAEDIAPQLPAVLDDLWRDPLGAARTAD
ncbi:MAG: NAD(P)H-hydrate dehydratase [Alphaproteobacteria bacterium]|nr:NAD(P)H-hydrate dehydratase [Alphaproteobacteria bacterium]MCW5740155.1 NAD(P)H-hydrate dehydratase [Alphaproteobacteria bacterium]